jgi:hypothetical protein
MENPQTPWVEQLADLSDRSSWAKVGIFLIFLIITFMSTL